MKKSLLYGALALAVAGGGVAAAAAAAPFAVAADSTAPSGASQPNQAVHHPRSWGGILPTAAQVLNMPPQQLAQELRGGQSIAQVAQNKGVSEQEVIDAIVQKISATLDQRVQAGELTQQKADQIKAKLPDRVKKIVEHKGPWQHGHPFLRMGVAQAASILGMTPQDLMTELKSGKSLVDVAESKGMSEEQLIDALINKEKPMLMKFVEHKWGGKKPAGSPEAGQGPAAPVPGPSSNSGASTTTSPSL
ncbi:hypothetical protein [Kyrpidia spormannii]|uniref:hypothetical protein n=1 Tax=Kyrpidia spormannii TaxID=2055160 RepID=UPI00147472D9|nr:hypothetical protein [Kyrpidia spormannii]